MSSPPQYDTTIVQTFILHLENRLMNIRQEKTAAERSHSDQRPRKPPEYIKIFYDSTFSKLSMEHFCAVQRRAKVIWQNLKHQKPSAVCFDMDSTLIQEETLDEYVRFFGLDSGGSATVTRQAMDGQMSFREALDRRLNLLRPTKAQFGQFVTEFKPTLSDGIAELITVLRKHGIDIFIVTGGFVEVAQRVAQSLNIPIKNIFANRILFNAGGCYEGFDKSQLTSQSGPAPIGKAGVCQLLKEQNGYKLIVMVGDGTTDMEAKPPADLFIGYGGNQIREKVRQGSDWFVYEFRMLTEALKEEY